MNNELVLPIVTLVSAGVGYLIKHILDRNKEAKERLLKDRREHYMNILLCLKSLKEGKNDKIELLRYEYEFLWLSASDKVIKAANDLFTKINEVNTNTNDINISIAQLMLRMRYDLGIRTSLSSVDYQSIGFNIK